VTVTGQDDAIDNPGDTRTTSIDLTATGGGYGSTTASLAVNVTDDDAAPTGITLSASPDEVAEDIIAVTVTVTATVDGTTRFGEARTVTISVGEDGDSAAEGTDYAEYRGVADFPIVIVPGAASGFATFVLAVEDDDIDENDEILTVSGSVDGPSPVTVTGTEITIIDDDYEEPAPPAPVPAKPTSLDATPGDKQVTLAWTLAPADATIPGWEYRQKKGDGDYASWIAIAGSDASTGSHTVMNLTNGIPYTFQVRAVNATGAGEASDAVTATPQPPFQPPPPPTPSALWPAPASVSAVPLHNALFLSWDDSGDRRDGYCVQIRRVAPDIPGGSQRPEVLISPVEPNILVDSADSSGVVANGEAATIRVGTRDSEPPHTCQLPPESQALTATPQNNPVEFDAPADLTLSAGSDPVTIAVPAVTDRDRDYGVQQTLRYRARIATTDAEGNPVDGQGDTELSPAPPNLTSLRAGGDRGGVSSQRFAGLRRGRVAHAAVADPRRP